jgi:hypothetical protein
MRFIRDKNVIFLYIIISNSYMSAIGLRAQTLHIQT